MKISRNINDNYINIEKVIFLDANKVHYSIIELMRENDIMYDESEALVVQVLPEDVDYPINTKATDSGQTLEQSIKVVINNQSKHTKDSLKQFENKKVIVVLYYATGKLIFGCNEQPLRFTYSENNSTNPANSNSYVIECKANTYFSKALI